MVKKYTLEVANIMYGFSSATLLKNVSFLARSGQIVNIIGDNGRGKTTLLRIIAGLIQPHTGKLFWCGRDISVERIHYCQTLLYIGHQTGLKPGLSALENLKLDCLLFQQNAKIGPDEALEQLGLGAIKNLPSEQLSAGQAKRLALARLLSLNAPLWLIDEPYTHLDQCATEMVNQLIVQHVKRGGIVVIATHAVADDLVHADVLRVALS